MKIAKVSWLAAVSVLALGACGKSNKTKEAEAPAEAAREGASGSRAGSGLPPAWVGEWVNPADESTKLTVRADGISFSSKGCSGELQVAGAACTEAGCAWTSGSSSGTLAFTAASKELTVSTSAGQPAPKQGAEGKVTATITVAPKKPDGKAWDFGGGKPDIGVCAEANGSKTCQPGGGTSIQGGVPAVCQDALSCTVELNLSGDTANLEVIDIDASENDPIGSGSCKVGSTCSLGAATVLLTAGAKPAAGACAPPAGAFVRAADLGARRAEAKAKEEAQARQLAEAKAPPKYPAPCASVEASTHVPVKGAEDLCVPVAQGLLAVSLLKDTDVLKPLPSSTSSYSDDNEIAVLAGPNAQAKETSSLSATERGAIGSRVRGTLYYKLERNWGDWDWNALAGKLSGTIDLGSSSLTVGEPSVKRAQKCETTEGVTCGGRCEDDGDCFKLFSLCGCSESQCNIFGRCTPCPSMHSCDDPTFDLTVPSYKVATTFTKAEDKATGEAAANRPTVLMLTRVTGAWRKVFTKTERDDISEKMETTVEHDTGHYARVSPTGLFLLDCPDGECGRGTKQLAAFNAQPWNLSLAHPTEAGTVKVACTGGKCSGTFTKGK